MNKNETRQTKWIVLLFFLLPALGIAQINQSIDLVCGIEYSYRHLTTSSDDFITQFILNYRNAERGKVHWQCGFHYNLRLKDRLFLKTGLRRASTGYRNEKQTDLRWPSEYDDMGNWAADPTLSHEIQITRDHWITEAPIAASFEISRKKLAAYLELGVSPTIHLTNRIVTETDIGKDTEFYTEEYKI